MASDDIEISEDGKFFVVDMRRFDEDEDYAWRVSEEIERSPRAPMPDLSKFNFDFDCLRQNDQYLEDIRQILSTQTASGFLSKPGHDHNGSKCTHHFSFAVGLASSHRLHKYRKLFGENPPSWVDQIHPQHVRLICELAIKKQKHLPQKLD